LSKKKLHRKNNNLSRFVSYYSDFTQATDNAEDISGPPQWRV